MHRILKNASYLGAGQVVKMLLRFTAFSMVTRHLGPERYGLYATVIGFCDFFVIFSMPGVSKPISREACRKQDQVGEVLSRYMSLRIVLAGVSLVVCNIAVWFMGYSTELRVLIHIYSATILFDSLSTYIRIVFYVIEDLKPIAYAELLKAVIYASLALAGVKFKVSTSFFIVAAAGSIISGLALDFILSRRFARIRPKLPIDLDRPFIESAVYFTLTNFVWIIVTKIDILMLSKLGPPEEVGIYNVANRLVLFGIMGLSVLSRASYPPMIKKIAKGSFNVLQFRKHLIIGALLVIGATVAIFFLAEFAINLVVGSAYIQSAAILKILAVYFALQCLSTPLKLILVALDREKNLLYVTLPLPIVKIAGNLAAYSIYGLKGVALATVAVYAVYTILLIGTNIPLLRKQFQI